MPRDVRSGGALVFQGVYEMMVVAGRVKEEWDYDVGSWGTRAAKLTGYGR